MKEIARLGIKGPTEARGRVQLDFTDPITGKVKDRVEGENHVFLDTIRLIGWQSAISELYMCLNDDSAAVDEDMPYLRGQVIGFGIPTYGSSGLYRGACNSANQILAQQFTDKVYWKFQYDFTPSQAIGTIRNVGLTRQYGGLLNVSSTYYGQKSPIKQFKLPAYSLVNTVSGRYAYSISASGVITRTDMWFGTTSTIDVSASVGTVETKLVGIEPSTGKGFVFVNSSTPGNRKMHVFSNNSFSALETTYTCSNVVFDSAYPMYVHGNNMFVFGHSDLKRADFVNNQAASTIFTTSTLPHSNAGSGSVSYLFYGTMTLSDRYVRFGSGVYTTRSFVIDLSTSLIAAMISNTFPANSLYEQKNWIQYPLLDHAVPCFLKESETAPTDAAATTYILPTAKTKTSDVGMTATYELEVYW